MNAPDRCYVPEMILHRWLYVPAHSCAYVSIPRMEWGTREGSFMALPLRADLFRCDPWGSFFEVAFADAPVVVRCYYESIMGPIMQPNGVEQRWNIDRVRIVSREVSPQPRVIRDNSCCYARDFDIVMRAVARTIRDGYSYERACRYDVAEFAAHYGGDGTDAPEPEE